MDTGSPEVPGLVVLVPLGRRGSQTAGRGGPALLKARSEERSGKKVIGLLDEGWAEPYFQAMKPFFEARWGEVEMRSWLKPLMSAPAPVPLIEEVAQECDAVIVGVGH